MLQFWAPCVSQVWSLDRFPKQENFIYFPDPHFFSLLMRSSRSFSVLSIFVILTKANELPNTGCHICLSVCLLSAMTHSSYLGQCCFWVSNITMDLPTETSGVLSVASEMNYWVCYMNYFKAWSLFLPLPTHLSLLQAK